jgi:hypothetical protein
MVRARRCRWRSQRSGAALCQAALSYRSKMQPSNGGRCSATVRGWGNYRERRQDFGGSRDILALIGGNECPHRRSRAGRGKRGAETAQFFCVVVSAGVVERGVEMRRRRHHPQANQHRQHDAQASLQPMRIICEGRQGHGISLTSRTGGTISQRLLCASASRRCGRMSRGTGERSSKHANVLAYPVPSGFCTSNHVRRS